MKIGTWIENESREVTRHGEYAGAHHKMLTSPGEYDVNASRANDWICAGIAATNVQDFFQNRIGACLGSATDNREPFDCEYVVQLDKYSVGRTVLAGRVVLDDPWVLVDHGKSKLTDITVFSVHNYESLIVDDVSYIWRRTDEDRTKVHLELIEADLSDYDELIDDSVDRSKLRIYTIGTKEVRSGRSSY